MLPFPYVEQTMSNDERWLDKNWLKFNFPLWIIVDFVPLVRPYITEAKAYEKEHYHLFILIAIGGCIIQLT